MKQDIAQSIDQQTKAAQVVASHGNRYAAYAGLDVHKDTIAVAVALLPGRDAPLYRGRSPMSRGRWVYGWIA